MPHGGNAGNTAGIIDQDVEEEKAGQKEEDVGQNPLE